MLFQPCFWRLSRLVDAQPKQPNNSCRWHRWILPDVGSLTLKIFPKKWGRIKINETSTPLRNSFYNLQRKDLLRCDERNLVVPSNCLLPMMVVDFGYNKPQGTKNLSLPSTTYYVIHIYIYIIITIIVCLLVGSWNQHFWRWSEHLDLSVTLRNLSSPDVASSEGTAKGGMASGRF